jgi:hypothetical protein
VPELDGLHHRSYTEIQAITLQTLITDYTYICMGISTVFLSISTVPVSTHLPVSIYLSIYLYDCV